MHLSHGIFYVWCPFRLKKLNLNIETLKKTLLKVSIIFLIIMRFMDDISRRVSFSKLINILLLHLYSCI